MSSPGDETKFANVGWGDVLPITATLFKLPIVLAWALFTSPLSKANKAKTWKRVLGDTGTHALVSSLNVAQLQYVLGSSLHVYQTWTKQNKLPSTVDELGDDSRLLWIGPKRTERVILYFHGGGFHLSPQECALSFWRHLQVELGKRNQEVGIAMMSYSLIPAASFPTPLRQAKLALDYLFASGVDVKNLQLAGDSAGGNLLLQVLSHILHPLDTIPSIILSRRIPSIYLMSPWISLTADSASHSENNGLDVLYPELLKLWGSNVLAGVPKSQNAYLEAVKAPESWFSGVDTVVDRVLITAGDAELLRDDIVAFAKDFGKHHSNVQFVLQRGGVHNDPFFDFNLLSPSKLGELTPIIVDWFAAGFPE